MPLGLLRFTNALGGTADFIYPGPAIDMQSPAAAVAVNGTVYIYYAQSFDMAQWEIGSGAYTSSSGTFARTTVTVNSSGTTAKINFSNPPQVMVFDTNTSLAANLDTALLALGYVKSTSIREKLTAARTYYVSTSGSDSNNGLTSGTPFLTIQKAYDTIAQTIDCGGQNILIQCANATYAVGISVNTAWTGGGNITLDLGGGAINGGSTTANIVAITVPLPGALTVQNGSLISNGYTLILHGGTGTLQIGDITLAGAVSVGYDMVVAAANADIHFIGNITFGACSGWREIFYAQIGGIVDLYGSFGQTMTMTGNMSWNDSFAYTSSGGAIQAISGARTINLGGFTMTGKRYTVNGGSVINTQGGGANYFPGSIAGGGAGTYL